MKKYVLLFGQKIFSAGRAFRENSQINWRWSPAALHGTGG
jgi:hypothetical protein